MKINWIKKISKKKNLESTHKMSQITSLHHLQIPYGLAVISVWMWGFSRKMKIEVSKLAKKCNPLLWVHPSISYESFLKWWDRLDYIVLEWHDCSVKYSLRVFSETTRSPCFY